MSRRIKSVEQSINETHEQGHQLKRNLGVIDLAVMGVAVAVGAGIFSVGAEAAANYAGPAVIISFIIAAAVCALAIMCYAEFASSIPVAGSAYTFTYSTMGEVLAWMIGWDLILETLMAGSVIAKYWGIYLSEAFTLFGLGISPTIALGGGVTLDWGPVVIVAIFTILLALGTRLSARVNAVFTTLKVSIVLFVIIVGFTYVKAENFHPFIPAAEPRTTSTAVLQQSLFSFLTGAQPSTYGIFGILSAASLVFFAFIGFDVVATSAEEAKDPKRTIPRGIMLGLAITTVLYILVAIVVTGMVNYKKLAATGNPSLATAFELVGANWAAKIITVGILIGLTTVVMVLLLGLARIIFAMSRDGLLPRSFSLTSAKHGTPAKLQIAVGAVIAAIAGFTNVGILSDMINIGTLSAFVLVSFGVPILRKSRPDLERTFKVPASPWLPWLSGLACLWLMVNLPNETWIRFVVWLVIGFIIYFSYSRRHSLVGLAESAADVEEAVIDTPH